jgi:peptidase E
MKTLLLASNGEFIYKYGDKLFHKPLRKMKLAYITTAGKDVSDTSYLKRHKDRMKKLGFNYEEIDIEGKNAKELRKLLQGKEAVHVEGGNTYYLLKHARKSGLKKVLEDLTEKGLIYIGTSAGSYLMTPGIQMSSWKKEKKPRNRHGLTDLRGLNLVPFLLFAHYKPIHKKMLKEKIKKLKYPLRILKDGQAVLVKGKKVEFLGGKEVIIK